MEEKNKKEVKKLSYEELEMAANQIAAQFDNVRKENIALHKQVQQLQMSNVYTELDFRFKVIKNAEAFSDEFVKYCIKSIEDIMGPQPDSKEEDTKEQ